jgi:hypothetical protein
MGTVSYPLTDSDLAELSRLHAAGKLSETKRSKLKSGGTNVYMTDGSWNYMVVETSNGDWSWGFKSECP